ncbi:hypothetical protein [Parageobacillus galactosidasius]|uniref:Uncharacterized protein n=1 Tax=Parageobacillus galactosidasius TaxID=883812 RepID=A0A226QQT6_9BACL|nr:hypothetical protein [Parageobacillus galactosidasius]OXB94853.1 hypothetical protein B9L23_08300 [Parageobacillus galactosidasius]
MSSPRAIQFLTEYGLWAINEIQVRVYSKKEARILYHKYEANAFEYEKVVRLTWLDRLKGITLEQKIDKKLSQLRMRLIAENQKIKQYKELEQRYNQCKK